MSVPCRIIVLESLGEWAAALRTVIGAGGPPLCEVRSVSNCEEELTRSPASFVIAELLEPSAISLIERIVAWQRRYPQAVIAVVASRDLHPWEGLLREAGAIHVVFSPRRLAPLVEAIRRHAGRYPQPTGTVVERIMAELPLAPVS
jgi:hypothetical protein